MSNTRNRPPPSPSPPRGSERVVGGCGCHLGKEEDERKRLTKRRRSQEGSFRLKSQPGKAQKKGRKKGLKRSLPSFPSRGHREAEVQVPLLKRETLLTPLHSSCTHIFCPFFFTAATFSPLLPPYLASFLTSPLFFSSPSILPSPSSSFLLVYFPPFPLSLLSNFQGREGGELCRVLAAFAAKGVG